MYFLLGYKKAKKLTSEAIELTLPEDLHIDVLLPAAGKILEAYQNGNIIEALKIVKEEYAPQAQAFLNGGDQGVFHKVTRYEE